MEFKINACYYESVVPPRCRIPRNTRREKEIIVNIKEMTAKTFPIAYAVTREVTGVNNDKKSFRFEIRSDDGKLFTQLSDSYSPWEKNIGAPKLAANGLKDCGLYSVRELYMDCMRAEEELNRRIEDVEGKLRIFNGTFWRLTEAEPCYMLDIDGYYSDKALLFFKVDGESFGEANNTENIFRADEKKLFVDKLNSLVRNCPESVRDSVKNEVKRVKAELKNNYIKVFEGAPHVMPPHEERKIAYTRRRVKEYVDDWNKTARADFPEKAEMIASFMRSAMYERVSNLKGSWTNGYVSTTLYDEAMQDILLELITEHNSATALITDRNVDGCGTDVSVCVRVKHPTDDSYTKLKGELIKQKDRCAKECLDTDEMVEHACDAAFGKDGWSSVYYDSLIDF